MRFSQVGWTTAISRMTNPFDRIGGRLFNAAAWTTLAYVTGQVLRFGGNLIMTRLLAPEMFGIMSIVLLIQVTLTMSCDFGLRIVVIQSKRGDEPAFLNTVWTLEVIRGASIWLLGILAALGLLVAGRAGLLPQGSAWTASELPAIIAAGLAGSFVTGLQSTRLMTGQRNLDVRSLTLIELFAQVVAVAGMVVIGLLTRSIWALVAGSLIAAVITTVLSHSLLPGLRNRFTWDASTVAEVYQAGRWVLLSSLLLVLASNADRFLLASYIGPAELGLFAIALNFILLVETVGSKLFSTVVFASLSEKARESMAELRSGLSRQRRAFDVGYLAASGLVFALGPWIIDVLYDDRYSAAGPMLRILALSLVFARYNIFPAAYLALGYPYLTASINVVKLCAVLILLPLLFYKFGLEGALFAVALQGLVTAIAILVINHRLQLNDFRLELMVLPAWLVGWGTAQLFLALVSAIS